MAKPALNEKKFKEVLAYYKKINSLLAPYVQAAMGRKDYLAAATLVGGALANLPGMDEGESRTTIRHDALRFGKTLDDGGPGQIARLEEFSRVVASLVGNFSPAAPMTHDMPSSDAGHTFPGSLAVLVAVAAAACLVAERLRYATTVRQSLLFASLIERPG